MFFGAACTKPLPPCLVQYLQPVGFRSLSSSSFLPSLLFDRRLLLLHPFEGGGEGEQEVDGDGIDLHVVFLSILRWPLILPLLWPPSLLSVVAYALFAGNVDAKASAPSGADHRSMTELE